MKRILNIHSVKQWALVLVMSIILITACSKLHNNNMLGNWEAVSLVVEKRGDFYEKFFISKYGYGNTKIAKDSSIELKFAIKKDLTVSRNVFGERFKATLIKAEYESFRRGVIKKTNKVFILEDFKKNTTQTKLYFDDEFMVSEYVDADSIKWKMFWLPK